MLKILGLVIVLFMFAPQIETAMTVEGAAPEVLAPLLKVVAFFLAVKYGLRLLKKGVKALFRSLGRGLKGLVTSRRPAPTRTPVAPVSAHPVSAFEPDDTMEFAPVC